MNRKIDTVTFRFFTCQSYNTFGRGYDKIEKVSSLEVVHFLEYAKVTDAGVFEDVKERLQRSLTALLRSIFRKENSLQAE